LYKFESGSVVILYPSTDKQEVIDVDAVINRFPYGHRLMTMAEIVEDLGIPTTLPTDSRVRRYQFFHQFGFPKVTFEVKYTLPPIKPLSREGMQSSQTVMAKWIGEQPIPRKHRHIEL
jgi:hypothetical protein